MHGSSLLKWENSAYAGITNGAVTLFFIILWWLDLSAVTHLALLVMFVAVADYAGPRVFPLVFKPEHWTGVQEKRYEQVCAELYNARVRLSNCWTCFQKAKEQKSTMVNSMHNCISGLLKDPLPFFFFHQFTVLLTSAMLLLAYVGATVNNMLLCYMVTLLVVNYPGLNSYGITDKVKALVAPHLMSLCKKAE